MMAKENDYFVFDSTPETPDSRSFRVVSYNVLADCYTKDIYFPYTSPNHLKFSTRGNRVVKELTNSLADIICLQVIFLYSSTISHIGG